MHSEVAKEAATVRGGSCANLSKAKSRTDCCESYTGMDAPTKPHDMLLSGDLSGLSSFVGRLR